MYIFITLFNSVDYIKNLFINFRQRFQITKEITKLTKNTI